MAPGPSMRWSRRCFRRLSIFCICTLCLRDIRILCLFHGVEHLMTYFKLLEVYPLISKKSSKIRGNFLDHLLHWFLRADERAYKFSINCGAFAFRESRDSGACATVCYILNSITSRHLYFDIGEASFREQLSVGLFFQRARDTTGPCLEVAANCLWKLTQEDNIRDGKTSSGREHTVRFAQHLSFIC